MKPLILLSLLICAGLSGCATYRASHTTSAAADTCETSGLFVRPCETWGGSK